MKWRSQTGQAAGREAGRAGTRLRRLAIGAQDIILPHKVERGCFLGTLRLTGMGKRGIGVRCGWPGCRTYRRAYRPPDGLSRNFDVLARFDGEHIDLDSFLTLCYPSGRQ